MFACIHAEPPVGYIPERGLKHTNQALIHSITPLKGCREIQPLCVMFCA